MTLAPAPLAAPPAASSAAARLVLVRMALPAKKPVPAKTVRDDVNKLLPSPLSQPEFDEIRSGLAAEGFLSVGKRNVFTVTDAGRQAALRFLGIAEFPPRINWNAVVGNHLFPKAAGLSSAAAAKLDDGDKLAALVLKRKYDLPQGAGGRIKPVLQALVCKELGFPEETSLDGLLCTVLSRLLGSSRLTAEKLVKQVPLFETGLSALRADDVRRLLVKEWLAKDAAHDRPASAANHATAEAPVSEEFDLEAFAATVLALAAERPPQERFHDDKAFIAPLWRASQREASFPRLTLDEFKQRLVEANARGLLHLSRADLVQEMDATLVETSEIRYLNAAFHFVRLEEGRS